MRQKLMPIPQDLWLERVLAVLAMDLAEAGDEEIVQAAEDLGMNVKMKGSAAFLGVYGLPKRIEDFFVVEDAHEVYTGLMGRRRPLPSKGEGSDDDQA